MFNHTGEVKLIMLAFAPTSALNLAFSRVINPR